MSSPPVARPSATEGGCGGNAQREWYAPSARGRHDWQHS